MMGVPALGVGDAEPTHELREFAIFARPNNHVPVIWHDAVGQQSNGQTRMSLFHHAFKRFVVGVFVEQCCPAVGPVQDVIDQSTAGSASASRHVGTLMREYC